VNVCYTTHRSGGGLSKPNQFESNRSETWQARQGPSRDGKPTVREAEILAGKRSVRESKSCCHASEWERK